MPPECARLHCYDDAIAICAIDPPATTVLLLPLTASVVGSPLCRRHVERLNAPAGWQLRDERRRSAPEPVTAPSGSDPSTTDRSRSRGDRELEALLEVRSPLLSRAFRTAGPG